MKRPHIETARSLRKIQTEAGKIIWRIVRNRGLEGMRILRQHPIRLTIEGKRRFFEADFYCPVTKRVLEVDGKIHEYQKKYDELRSHIISILGIRVVRIRNEEVNDSSECREKLKRLFDSGE